MPWQNYFVFDLGNVVLKLAYERVVARVCSNSSLDRDSLVALLEDAGGYRDLERGAISFDEFHDFLVERAGFRGGYPLLVEIWEDFFDGPIEGIEEVMERVRQSYRVAFLSNSNELHAELIPKRFAILFRKEDRFIFSHRCRLAKPDPALFLRALEILGVSASQTVYVDDLQENVTAALQLGMRAFLFRNARALLRELEENGLLPRERPEDPS
jgi:HAD superfamily hydrolase (TIGR01509 family)